MNHDPFTTFGVNGRMAHIMLDLETRGQRPGCAILSIGAVAFDPHRSLLGDRFHVVINSDSCRDFDLFDDADTMAWWNRQKPEARAVLDQAAASEIKLPQALDAFASFVRSQAKSEARVWGNGADFDQPILAACYQAARMPLPWKFWNSRCFRTIKNLTKIPAPPRQGVHHNALDDAVFQATHALAILQGVRRLEIAA